MKNSDVTGIILAGGKSKRFGSNKALYSYHGKKLINYTIEALQPVCADIIISTNVQEDFKFTGLRCIPDIRKNSGPLAGIHAGLTASDTKYNLFAPCDMPGLVTDIFQFLLNQISGYQMAMVVHQDILQPQVSCITKNAVPQIEEAIGNQNLQLQQMPDYIPAIIGISEKQPFYHASMFQNINTPQDVYLKPYTKS
jgi:molybdopterin-guanine dinucleotide biosynthesis protein A